MRGPVPRRDARHRSARRGPPRSLQRGPNAGNKQLARELKGARFAVWKNPENLTDRQQAKLASIQHTNAGLYRAYLLREQLRQIYRLPAAAAIQLLDGWLKSARRSRLPSFVKLGLRGRARPIPRVSLAGYRGGFACPRGGVVVHDKHGYRGGKHQQREGEEWERVVGRRLSGRAKLNERHDQDGGSHGWKDHVSDRGERGAVAAPHEHREREVGQ